MKFSPIFSLFLFLLTAATAKAQQPGTGGKSVDIIYADRFYFSNPDANTSIQRLAGNVQLRQGTSLFWCDSCIINNSTKIFEAFGKVHINDNDTTNIYSDYLRYLPDTKKAYLNGNVRLTDGKATLTTPDLEYDMGTNIGIYRNGGRVVNKKSVLTSQEGVYYTDVRDIYFKRNVKLKDPSYTLTSDSLLYNTETQMARFIAETYIIDSSKRTIRTHDGFYDVANRKAEFTSRTFITDGALKITGDHIASDDATGNIQIEGRGVLIDTAQGINILADQIFANKQKGAYLATKKPLMIIKQDNDSIYIAADTLFSARLTDLYKPDSVTGIASKKSLQSKGNKKQRDTVTTVINANNPVIKDSAGLRSDSLLTLKDTAKNTKPDSLHIRDTLRLKSDSMKAKIDSLTFLLRDSLSKKELANPKQAAPKLQPKGIPPQQDSVRTRMPGMRQTRGGIAPRGRPDTANIPVDTIRKESYSETISQDSIRKRRMALKEKDSTNRYFEAYRHVRIFSDSLQAVSDSLFYTFQDSVFELYQNPIVWSRKSQVTGDTIFLYTKNKKADRMKVFLNSFMVNEVQGGVYNQIKSIRIDGFFKAGKMDSVRARGEAESIYFIQDDDSAFASVNQTKSDIIDAKFDSGQLYKVIFRRDLKGTVFPVRQKPPGAARLTGFRWLEARRPKTKYELFE